MAQQGERKEGIKRDGRKAKRGEGGREEEVGGGATLLVTAQKLHSQGDVVMPLPRQDADVLGVERRLKDVLFVNVVVAVAWENLVCLCGLVLNYGPQLSIITVGDFEGCDKLDRAKVFGSLCDDSCDPLGRLKVNLYPLRSVVGSSSPGVGLALFVQPGVVRVPGEGLNAPGAEGAGGCNLAIRHQSGLHAHWL